MFKKIILSLILLFFQITNTFAVELAITNDISNILNSKKICIRLSLDPQDQAIYSNSLNFSVDHPEITVVSWECKQNPTMQYVTKFKRIKKLYTQSLSCEVALNFESDNKKAALQNLSKSNLYISCIVLNKNGMSQPVSLAKALDDGFSLIDTGTYSNLFSNNLNYDTIKTFTKNYFDNKNPDNKNQGDKNETNKKLNTPQKPIPEPANIIIDNLKSIWRTLVSKMKSFFTSLNYIFLYLIIFILMILLLFKKLNSRNIWLIEIRRFLGLCWILSTYSFLKLLIPQYIFFAIFAVLIAPISMYYIFTARTESTLDKLKSFIGFALAMSMLPLLIKAYLSFMFY
ncbi:MAG: hypothetical protein WC192_02670 [Candidatus Babeliales bacterium]|jgi:hypothetical protein